MPRVITDADVAIGQHLRTIRLRQGVTVERLAEMLGLSFQQVCKYEHGTNRLTLSRAVAICNALGVPLDMLAYGRGVEDCASFAPRRRRHASIPASSCSGSFAPGAAAE